MDIFNETMKLLIDYNDSTKNLINSFKEQLNETIYNSLKDSFTEEELNKIRKQLNKGDK